MSNKPVKFITLKKENKKTTKKWCTFHDMTSGELSWNDYLKVIGLHNSMSYTKLIQNVQNAQYSNAVMTIKHLKVDVFLDYAAGVASDNVIEQVSNFFRGKTTKSVDLLANDAQKQILRSMSFIKVFLHYIPAGVHISDDSFKFSANEKTKEIRFDKNTNIFKLHPEWIIAETSVNLSPDTNSHVHLEAPLTRNLKPNDSVYITITTLHKSTKFNLVLPKTYYTINYSFTSCL